MGPSQPKLTPLFRWTWPISHRPGPFPSLGFTTVSPTHLSHQDSFFLPLLPFSLPFTIASSLLAEESSLSLRLLGYRDLPLPEGSSHSEGVGPHEDGESQYRAGPVAHEGVHGYHLEIQHILPGACHRPGEDQHGADIVDLLQGTMGGGTCRLHQPICQNCPPVSPPCPMFCTHNQLAVKQESEPWPGCDPRLSSGSVTTLTFHLSCTQAHALEISHPFWLVLLSNQGKLMIQGQV